MKVILSRKGFDSAAGGMPSPILPDGTLLSLPVPDTSGRAYSEISYNGKSYADLIKELSPITNHANCHLDPDIRKGVFHAPADWQPAFGQGNAALTLLNRQGVGVGDLFLFFGWFKQTESIDGKLRFTRGARDLHIIYGYLQVGEMITDADETAKFHWHPHATSATGKNCIYIPSDTLSWDSTKPGYGVFQFSEWMVLTKDGMKRSCWDLPSAFKELSIPGSYKDAWRTDPLYGDYYRSMTRGQEFVIEENPVVTEWAQKITKLTA